jgi:hypothetical protein
MYTYYVLERSTLCTHTHLRGNIQRPNNINILWANVTESDPVPPIVDRLAYINEMSYLLSSVSTKGERLSYGCAQRWWAVLVYLSMLSCQRDLVYPFCQLTHIYIYILLFFMHAFHPSIGKHASRASATLRVKKSKSRWSASGARFRLRVCVTLIHVRCIHTPSVTNHDLLVSFFSSIFSKARQRRTWCTSHDLTTRQRRALLFLPDPIRENNNNDPVTQKRTYA